MSEFPTASEGKRAWREGHDDARANKARAPRYDRPRREVSFRDGCLSAAYHQGYNHGTQEALQEAYGAPPLI